MRKVIIVDISKCMSCHNCELACATAHSTSKDLAATVLAGERPGYRINVEACGRHAVPVLCRHCDEPACAKVCPTGAIYRDAEGEPVLFDQERCIGCGMCMQACPFGVITLRPNGKGVLKCDLCIERLAKGLDPACVDACPTGALAFVDAENTTLMKRRRTAGSMVTAYELQQQAVEA